VKVLFCLLALCSARVSALVIVLNDSPYERVGKWETCPVLKEDIVCAHLAGVSVVDTASLLGVSRETISKVLSVYTNYAYEEEPWAEMSR
jgi:hypothetical protein